MVDGLTYDERQTVLKVRIGNGDSAVDVEWLDKELCWTVQARAFGAYWFTVVEDGKAGYNSAIVLAGELEARIQRMIRLRQEVESADNDIRVFIQEHRHIAETKANPGAEQCA